MLREASLQWNILQIIFCVRMPLLPVSKLHSWFIRLIYVSVNLELFKTGAFLDSFSSIFHLLSVETSDII